LYPASHQDCPLATFHSIIDRYLLCTTIYLHFSF
jgi:hypothetical protein